MRPLFPLALNGIVSTVQSALQPNLNFRRRIWHIMCLKRIMSFRAQISSSAHKKHVELTGGCGGALFSQLRSSPSINRAAQARRPNQGDMPWCEYWL